MEKKMAMFPFEAAFVEIWKDPDTYVDAVFSCLESESLANSTLASSLRRGSPKTTVRRHKGGWYH